MKIKMVAFALITLVCTSCGKNVEDPADNPAAGILAGKWQQGNYDINDFWRPASWESLSQFTPTGAFHINNNDTAELYGISFPPVEADCSKQDYKYTKGSYSINLQDSSFTFTPSEGKLRTFYKNCPAQTDVNRDLTPAELNGTLKFYWRLRHENGKQYLLIRYAPDATAFTWMEKKNNSNNQQYPEL